MADALLSYLIDAKDKASGTFRKVSGSAKDTKKSLDETSAGAKGLSKQMDETRSSLAALHKEFEKTGDPKLLTQIRKGERDLKNLEGWAKRFTPQIGESTGALGKLSGSLSSIPVSGPIAAAAAIGAIPATALVAGAALTGLGLGFVGLGALAVKNSDAVKDAASDLASTAQSEFTKAGAVMEKPIVRALGTIRKTVQDLGPDLNDMFSSVAPHVDNLAVGVDGFAREAMPGFKRAVMESGGVLDVFAGKLPETGRAVGSFFDSLANSADGGGKALAATMGLINAQLATTGKVIELGSKGFDEYADGFLSFTGSAGPGLIDVLSKVDETEKKVAESTAKAAKETKAHADAQKKATAEYERGTNALADYAANLEIASGGAISVARAEMGVIKSRNDLTQSIKDNGTALVGNSDKAMANREALLQGVEAANRHATALEKDGHNQGEVTAIRQRDIEALRAWAIKQGMATKDVDAFIASVNKVKPVALTKIETPGSQAAFLALARHNAEAQKIPRNKSTTLSANVTYGSADAAARWRGAGPPASRSSTLRLNVQYGSADAAARWRGGATGGLVGGLTGRKNAPGFRAGGLVAGGGTTTSDSVPIWASKKEFVTQASSVDSIGVKNMEFMNRTGRIPQAGGGGGPVRVEISTRAGASRDFMNVLLEALRYEVRTAGRGSVQTLLGEGA